MGGEDDLHIRVQLTNQAYQPLLPLHVEGNFGLVHEEYARAVVLHQDGEEDNEQLLLARRELVGIERVSILFEEDFVALAENLLARLAEEFIDEVLELGFGLRDDCSLFGMSRGEALDDAVTHVHLIVEVPTLELIELPVEFRLHVLVRHLLHQVAVQQRAVEAPYHVVMDVGGIFGREDETHAQ